MHLAGERVVLDLLVTLEDDLINDRVFGDSDGHDAAALADIHVLEKTGRDQRLQALVSLGAVIALAFVEGEIGLNCLGLDPLTPNNPDLANDGARLRICLIDSDALDSPEPSADRYQQENQDFDSAHCCSQH